MAKVGVPAVELENVILNPGIIEGFSFQITDVKTTVVVFETIDHDGLNDDEIECVITIKPFTKHDRKVLLEKIPPI